MSGVDRKPDFGELARNYLNHFADFRSPQQALANIIEEVFKAGRNFDRMETTLVQSVLENNHR